jgi:hypothetical protein
VEIELMTTLKTIKEEQIISFDPPEEY